MTNCCLICWLFLHFVVGLPWKKGCQQTLLVLFHLHLMGSRSTPGLLNWNYMCLTNEVSGGLWVVNPVHVCCLKVPAHVYDHCSHSTGPQMFLVLFFCFLRVGFPLFHACWLVAVTFLLAHLSIRFRLTSIVHIENPQYFWRYCPSLWIQAVYSSSRVMIMVCVMTWVFM